MILYTIRADRKWICFLISLSLLLINLHNKGVVEANYTLSVFGIGTI